MVLYSLVLFKQSGAVHSLEYENTTLVLRTRSSGQLSKLEIDLEAVACIIIYPAVSKFPNNRSDPRGKLVTS